MLPRPSFGRLTISSVLPLSRHVVTKGLDAVLNWDAMFDYQLPQVLERRVVANYVDGLLYRDATLDQQCR